MSTRKSQEQTARQLLNWMIRNLVRLEYHSGDDSVGVYGIGVSAVAKSTDQRDVLDAIKRARIRWIRDRARDRRDRKAGIWPYSAGGAR